MKNKKKPLSKSKDQFPPALLKLKFSKFPEKAIPVYFEPAKRAFYATFGFDRYEAPSVSALETKIKTAIKKGATPDAGWKEMIELSIWTDNGRTRGKDCNDVGLDITLERNFLRIAAGGKVMECPSHYTPKQRAKSEGYQYQVLSGRRITKLDSPIYMKERSTWSSRFEVTALLPFDQEIWKELTGQVQAIRADYAEYINEIASQGGYSGINAFLGTPAGPKSSPSTKSTKSTPSTKSKLPKAAGSSPFVPAKGKAARESSTDREGRGQRQPDRARPKKKKPKKSEGNSGKSDGNSKNVPSASARKNGSFNRHDRQLHAALHSFEGAKNRWDILRRKGADDRELMHDIGYELGSGGTRGIGGSKSTGEIGDVTYRGGDSPAIWFDSLVAKGKPNLAGGALISAVRRLLGIPEFPLAELRKTESNPAPESFGKHENDGRRDVARSRLTADASPNGKKKKGPAHSIIHVAGDDFLLASPGPLPLKLQNALHTHYPALKNAHFLKDGRIQLVLGINGDCVYMSALDLQQMLDGSASTKSTQSTQPAEAEP